MNNYRRAFQLAIVLNAILAVGLFWVWLRSHGASDGGSQKSQSTPTQSSPASPANLAAPTPSEAPLAPIQLTPERMQSIGVKIGTAEFKDVSDELRLTGVVEIDEKNVADIHLRYPGWVKKVFVNSTYRYVRKNDPLLTIYSPEVVSTEKEYLLARQNQKELGQSSVEGVASGAASLVGAAEQRLRQWDVPPQEIARLKQTGQVNNDLVVYSPVSGYVTEKNVLASAYVQPETRLYTVSDLSTVWVNAQLFENDLGRLRTGGRAEVSVEGYPGKTFGARIEQILPQVDAATRTMRVRLSIRNAGRLLSPGMFVNVALKSSQGRKLVVPASSVFNSGTRQLVFLDRGNGNLEPREVEVGASAGDDVAVLSGLQAGDRVVTSANFLIDSEAQLQAAAGAFAPPPPGAGVAASTNKAPELMASLVFSSDPTPPRKGKNSLRVKLSGPGDSPVTGAEVTATFYMVAMPAMGMAAMRTVAVLNDKGGGAYEGQAELTSGGTYQVTIVARQNGRTIAQKQFSANVEGSM